MNLIKQYWQAQNETLYTTAPPPHLPLDQKTIEFLTQCGLPEDTAPFLIFSELKDGRLTTPAKAFGIEREDLERYLMFGCNGSGDPLCVDLSNNQIVYLNHDNDFERIYINSHIITFAQSLIVRQEFGNSIIDVNDPAYGPRKFSDTEFETFWNRLHAIDPNSLNENCFWNEDLDYLRWEREND